MNAKKTNRVNSVVTRLTDMYRVAYVHSLVHVHKLLSGELADRAALNKYTIDNPLPDDETHPVVNWVGMSQKVKGTWGVSVHGQTIHDYLYGSKQRDMDRILVQHEVNASMGVRDTVHLHQLWTFFTARPRMRGIDSKPWIITRQTVENQGDVEKVNVTSTEIHSRGTFVEMLAEFIAIDEEWLGFCMFPATLGIATPGKVYNLRQAPANENISIPKHISV